MEGTHQDFNSKQIRPEEPELDFYTIPSHSSWFSWDDIHETEREAVKEFFYGNSITRTPKVYKEYRDFIITKYREDPSRRLTFTEVRKSLVGDVSLLRKVFSFLERWGLINFSAPSPCDDTKGVNEESLKVVVIEEGAPNGVRVVAMPNSLKPISLPPRVENGRAEVAECGFKSPPLTSYSDVFGRSVKRRPLGCGNCGQICELGRYQHTKVDYTICVKCFENGNYGENKSMEDFIFNDINENSDSPGPAWTESETFLLLDSVLKHGDDWELVAQNFPTKSKLECISKLIELPFGDVLMGSAHGKVGSSIHSSDITSLKQVLLSSSVNQEKCNAEDKVDEKTNEVEQNGDTICEDPPSKTEQNGDAVCEEEPPSKRQRVISLSNNGSSLMKQVALVSSMVGPHVAAAAAEAAVTALCNETSCPREIFEEDEWPHQIEDSEMKESPSQSETHKTQPKKHEVPLTLRIRAAVATSLGAAAAHAKLLADQEDREIENLVATVLETQLEKLQSKVKHFDDLEVIMEKEHTGIEELKESILQERIDLLQRAFNAGVSKRWEHTSLKSPACNLDS